SEGSYFSVVSDFDTNVIEATDWSTADLTLSAEDVLTPVAGVTGEATATFEILDEATRTTDQFTVTIEVVEGAVTRVYTRDGWLDGNYNYTGSVVDKWMQFFAD